MLTLIIKSLNSIMYQTTVASMLTLIIEFTPLLLPDFEINLMYNKHRYFSIILPVTGLPV